MERPVRNSWWAHGYEAGGVRPPPGLEGSGDDVNLFPKIMGDDFGVTRSWIKAKKASRHANVATTAYDLLPDSRAVAGSRVPRQVMWVNELASFFCIRQVFGRRLGGSKH